MSLVELFAQDRDAVVTAGAGTGKTHSLVTLCLHLLGGIGRAEPLAPAGLCAVTFTEKAAAELRARIRARLDGLAEALDDTERRLREPGLFATLDALGAPAPLATVWQKARRDLGLAQVGTLHALCAQILRRNAAAAGLDPSFELMDELESRALLREACERAVLGSLENESALCEAARRLVSEWNFRGTSRFVRGLADELETVTRILGESDIAPTELVRHAPALQLDAMLEAELEARRRLVQTFAGLETALLASASVADSVQAWRELCAAFAGTRMSLLAAPAGALASVWPRLEPLERLLATRKSPSTLGEAQQAVRDDWEGLVAADADVRAARLGPDLALLAERVLALHTEEKERRSLLDFDDLTRRAGALLARRADVRAAEQARFGAVLVDEFQDTSQSQLALIRHLAGEGEAADGRRLVVVGDWKQSIYEFRGADLARVRGFAERALAGGAERFALRDSRRSRPPLVRVCNQLFLGVLGNGTLPFEAPFVPGVDDLAPTRPEHTSGPCVELISCEGPASRKLEHELEPDAVARRVAALLAPGAPERVFERRPDGSEIGRAPRGGDVALLFRSLTHIDDYRRALLRWRVPHVLFKGRGFHQAREVLDLRALLTLVLDPGDEAALATVLRSPLGPLSDDALALMALWPQPGAPIPAKPRSGKLRLERLRDPALLDALAPDDRACTARLSSIIERLRRASVRLGPAALLEAALAETDVVAALAGGLFGEQAAANLGKLVDLAHAVERRGGGIRELLARLELLDDDVAGEAEAPVTEESDPHAVRLLTVHASKGLEFPIVLVPECGAPPPNANLRVLHDPDLGLALKVRSLDGQQRFGAAGGDVEARRKAREAAEARRLLYVAATRARDLLIFSGRPGRAGTWRALLDAALPVDPALVRRLVPEDLARLHTHPRRAPVETLEDLLALDHAALPPGEPSPAERRLASSSQVHGTIEATVTQLADAQSCALRYRLLHELGLDERPPPVAQRPPEARDPEGAGLAVELMAGEQALTASERGTLAHGLLERVPLATPTPALGETLERLLADEGERADAHRELLDSLLLFLTSPLGERLRHSGTQDGAELRRELPFALRLEPPVSRSGAPTGPALVVVGQLDALLLEPGAATVIDYKHAEKRPLARYSAQLSAYALAAHALGGRPVRTGLVFLRSRGAFVEGPRASEAERAAATRSLLSAAQAIEQGTRTGEWPKAEVAVCRAIECGFVKRCHPEGGAS